MADLIEIFVVTLTGVSFEIQVCPFDAIESIKTKIQYFEGIPISQQHLIWQNEELDDKACFQDYDICDGSTLKLVLGLRGGPINTKRITSGSLSKLAQLLCDAEMKESNPLTVIVFQDGENLSMYTVINNDEEEEEEEASTDSTSSIGDDPSMRKLEAENDALAIIKENNIMQEKISMLQLKMKDLHLSRVKKRKKAQSPTFFKRSTSHTLKLPPIIIKESQEKCSLVTDTKTISNIRNQNIQSTFQKNSTIPLNNLQKCTSTLKAMGVKLPSRKTNLPNNRISSHRSYLSIPPREKKSSSLTTERPKTSPGVHRENEFVPISNLSNKPLYKSSLFTRAHIISPIGKKPLSLSKPYPNVCLSNSVINLSEIKDIESTSAIKIKKKSKRCVWCRRKTGLATSYTCYCGKNYCGRHRYGETHNCTFDYKAAGKKHLHAVNPSVKAPKLPKI